MKLAFVTAHSKLAYDYLNLLEELFLAQQKLVLKIDKMRSCHIFKWHAGDFANCYFQLVKFQG